MRQKAGPQRPAAEQVIKDIRRATRKHHSAEDKIRIVLEGLRGEDSIAALCRREGIAEISRQLAAVHLDLLGASKSLRHPASQTIRPGNSHSPHPRNSALESCDGRSYLISESRGHSSITAR